MPALLAATGRAEDGLAQLAVVEWLDLFGLMWIPWVNSMVLFSAGKDAECIRVARQMDHLPKEAKLFLAIAHERLGEWDAAVAAIKQFLDRSSVEMPTFPGPQHGRLATDAGALSEHQAAERLRHNCSAIEPFLNAPEDREASCGSYPLSRAAD